jgi:hypothetical protein
MSEGEISESSILKPFLIPFLSPSLALSLRAFMSALANKSTLSPY